MAQTVTEKVTAFFTSFPLKTFDKGEILIQAHAQPPAVFYLVEGRVAQYDITKNGNVVIVNIFKPRAFFPMSWAINRTPNPYFFEASTKVIAHKVEADAAVQFLQDNPDVMFDLLSRVYRGTDGVLRRMAHLMGGSARSRLLFELLNASLRFGSSAHGDEVLITLKEGDLAKHSGLARESVNRVVQALKAEGLIEVTQQGILVSSLERLQAELGNDL